MNRQTHALTVAGASRNIPLKEFELLFKLTSYPGQTLAREQLIEDLWGYDFAGNERTLDCAYQPAAGALSRTGS